MALVTKACLICGQGSTRKDWKYSSGEFVACDHHTKEEFTKAVAAASNLKVPPKTPQTPPVGQPSSLPVGGSTKPPTVQVPENKGPISKEVLTPGKPPVDPGVVSEKPKVVL